VVVVVVVVVVVRTFVRMAHVVIQAAGLRPARLAVRRLGWRYAGIRAA